MYSTIHIVYSVKIYRNLRKSSKNSKFLDMSLLIDSFENLHIVVMITTIY